MEMLISISIFWIRPCVSITFIPERATEEHIATDRIVSDGIWSGSKKILIDELKLGLYFFEVIDKESKILLYSRGFASVFGEWQTIPEAGKVYGTFHESMRFPWPLKTCYRYSEKTGYIK